MDVSNAFNSLSRSTFFEDLRDGPDSFQQLIPLVRLLYGNETDLFYPLADQTVHRIASSTGTRQGDPLGGPLFMLGHSRALKAVSAKFPEVLFPSLADDTHILGPGHLVGPAFLCFKEELAKLNLSVKVDKCEIYGRNLQGEVPDLGSTFLGVPASEEGMVVLNNPIGTPEFVAAQLEVILQGKLAGIQELPRLGDSQVAFSLLTKCFHTRPHYTLRGTKIGESALPPLRAYEEKLLQSHDEILGYVPGEFPALARKQATLPVSKGGHGPCPPLRDGGGCLHRGLEYGCQPHNHCVFFTHRLVGLRVCCKHRHTHRVISSALESLQTKVY